MPQPVSNAQALTEYTEIYDYDPAGNLVTVSHQSGAGSWTREQVYAVDSNHLTASRAGCANEGIAVTHDANGNLTRLSHLPNFTWGDHDRLVGVQLNAGGNPNVAVYQYDAAGRRVRKTVSKNGGNTVEERIYLGSYELSLDRDSSGSVTQRRETVHVMDDRTRVALIETERDPSDPAVELSTEVRYQLTNHLGSSVLEVDASSDAQIVSYEEYYPFGGTAYLAGRSWVEVNRKRYRYSGRERDDETGLIYYGARYYAPWLGRWLSPDPILATDHLNLYVFVRNNPATNVDAGGMKTMPGLDPQQSIVVGQATGDTMLVDNLETGYSVNIDPTTGVIRIQEGDWLTKASAALTGSMDPEDAARNFEILVDGEWVSFETGIDPDRLEIDDVVRYKPWAANKGSSAQKSVSQPSKPELYGAEIDPYGENAKVWIGIDKQVGRVGGTATRVELEGGRGGVSLTGSLAGVRGKVPVGAADLDVALDTPKGALGVYTGRETIKDNGDHEILYGAEAIGSLLEVSAGSQTDDGTVGGGGSLGVGAGFKAKAVIRSDAQGVKSISFDLEGKLVGGGNAQFTIPLRNPVP